MMIHALLIWMLWNPPQKQVLCKTNADGYLTADCIVATPKQQEKLNAHPPVTPSKPSQAQHGGWTQWKCASCYMVDWQLGCAGGGMCFYDSEHAPKPHRWLTGELAELNEKHKAEHEEEVRAHARCEADRQQVIQRNGTVDWACATAYGEFTATLTGEFRIYEINGMKFEYDLCLEHGETRVREWKP